MNKNQIQQKWQKTNQQPEKRDSDYEKKKDRKKEKKKKVYNVLMN